jgi:hypothetical protein
MSEDRRVTNEESENNQSEKQCGRMRKVSEGFIKECKYQQPQDHGSTNRLDVSRAHRKLIHSYDE